MFVKKHIGHNYNYLLVFEMKTLVKARIMWILFPNTYLRASTQHGIQTGTLFVYFLNEWINL